MDDMTLLKKIDETCAGVGLDAYLEGLVWPLSIPGVKARVSTIQSPMINMVGMATFTEANANDGIQNVIARYRQEEKMFGWLVGPTSRPANLGDHLISAGFIHIEEEAMWGMVLRDLNSPIAVNPEIRVEQVTLADWYANISMITRAYGFDMTEEVANTVTRLHESLGAQSKIYLAYAPDQDEPVAFSASIFDDDKSVVVLGGAATVKEYRGKGIYSTMVAKRLEDAQVWGATSAIIQAVKQTSAPICAQMGFEIICPIDLYAYMFKEE